MQRKSDAMNDKPLHPLALLIIGGSVCGCLLLALGAAPLTNWLNGTQEITVSSVAAADNCETATAVGDDACNQNVAVIGLDNLALIGLGLFLIVGWFAVMLLFAVL